MNTEFNEVEFNLAYPDGVETNYWLRARNFILYNTLKKHKLKTKPIIEIGCGRGVVIKYLKDRNIDCFGVELADVPPVNGVKDSIKTGTNALDLPEDFAAGFKTMMLLDVIEHIEDDEAFLKAVLAKYSNVTNLVITVPSRKEIWSNFDEFYRHFRRYDIKMMRDLIDKIGFEVKDVRYAFKAVYFSILLMKRFKTKRILTNQTATSSLMKVVYKVIAFCFIFEYWIMSKSMYGSSILCVAKRKS